MSMAIADNDFQIEIMEIAELHAHPRNYRAHPDDQLEHIIQSIREHGLYRNIVVARDGTILAGHGVVEALRHMGIERVPAIRLDISPDDPQALKILAGDNEISHLAERDDRALTELLKEINEIDINGLLGTGFDEMMLANLAYITRPANEIKDFDAAAEWVGLPEYEPAPPTYKLIINFRSEEDRNQFIQMIGLAPKKAGLKPNRMGARSLSAWWPPKERQDHSSLYFEG